MSPFEPLGDAARWRIVYEYFARGAVEDTVTYDELAAALDLDPVKDRHTIQMAARRAARELLEVDKRAAEAVTNTGYRIVAASDQLRLARGKQKRAEVQVKGGQSLATNVDFNGMEPAIRQTFEVVAQAFRFQAEMMKQLDVRQRKLEDAVESMRTEAKSDGADLRRRLAEAEAAIIEMRAKDR